MTVWPTKSLGDVAEFYAGASLPQGEAYESQRGGFFLVKVSDMNLPGNEKFIRSCREWSQTPGARSATCPVGSVLIPKRGGAIGTNKKRVATRPSVLDPNLMAIWPRPEVLDLGYLYQWLQNFDLSNIASGSSVPQLNKRDLEPLLIPMPPLEEQRRIAQVLDRADVLRTKRRQALSHLDELAQSIFFYMFGDAEASRNVPIRRPLSSVLRMGLRNGVSPSNSGSTEADVLTLSAITGTAFNSEAKKRATFNGVPPAHQTVSTEDFLICRGNGNLALVGKGYYPTVNMPETAFPDTVIAARTDPTLIHPSYLQQVWSSGFVRRQVESIARTTNGTFKVNQTMLGNIEIPVPAVDLQNEFAERIRTLDRLRATHYQHMACLNSIFASLQYRAFRGEL
jgi:type I restriction enzyme, S subunit